MKKILFISGSLRKESFNRQLLDMAAELVGNRAECSFLDYRNIPFMNQDLESPEPDEIKRVRAEIRRADVLWIASPEYNHSYSGVLKNLLDWLSRPTVPGDYSTAVIRGKKVALSSVAGSSAGSFSLGKLSELLSMLSCTEVGAKTSIALGSRFSGNVLELTEEEQKALNQEVEEVLK